MERGRNMLQMLLYGIGIMYTPGPVNIMGLTLGLNKKFKKSIGFFTGVGIAMFILFFVYGYTGEKFIKKDYLIYTSIIGGIYIFYLAIKVFKEDVSIDEKLKKNSLTSKDGFIMQIINPKASLAALPIATINFPANNINGIKIMIMSVMFGLLVIGAPSIYCLLGQFFSDLIKQKKILLIFNKIMGVILLYVAFSIFKDHVYDVIIGKNPY
jgi:threonine/homoserine/homoserine lactone efflux protein